MGHLHRGGGGEILIDKPKGKELKATLALKKLIPRVDRIHEPLEIVTPSHGNFETEIFFALDAVRTNGWQRLHTAWDAIVSLRLYREDIHRGLAAFVKADAQAEQLLKRAEKIMSIYRACPACKGKNGKNTGLNQWTDCSTCGGRGMLPARLL